MSKIIFTLPPELLKDLDEYCREKKYTRSELLRLAIRSILYGEATGERESK